MKTESYCDNPLVMGDTDTVSCLELWQPLTCVIPYIRDCVCLLFHCFTQPLFSFYYNNR